MTWLTYAVFVMYLIAILVALMRFDPSLETLKAGSFQALRGVSLNLLMAAYRVAVVHAELDPPNCPRVPLSGRWRAPGAQEVHIHGDFNCRNIHYMPHSDTPVVLDWTLSPMVGGRSTVGPRWFDVAWFVSSLFFLRRRLIFPRRLEEKADRFLAAYASRADCQLDEEVASRFVESAYLLRLEKQASSSFRRAFHIGSSRRLRRYLRRGFN